MHTIPKVILTGTDSELALVSLFHRISSKTFDEWPYTVQVGFTLELRRRARRLHTCYERACSDQEYCDDNDPETGENPHTRRAEQRVLDLVENTGFSVRLHQDPRGCPVHLIHNTDGKRYDGFAVVTA